MHYNKSHSLSVQIPKGHSLYLSPAFFFTPYLSSPITVILLPQRWLICFIFISFSVSLFLFTLSIIIFFSAFLLKMWGRWQTVNYPYMSYISKLGTFEDTQSAVKDTNMVSHHHLSILFFFKEKTWSDSLGWLLQICMQIADINYLYLLTVRQAIVQLVQNH